MKKTSKIFAWALILSLLLSTVAGCAPAVKTYTVTWMNGDEVLSTEVVKEGTVPTYVGAAPTMAETDEAVYTFIGWSPEIAAVTEDVTYTAQFSATKKFTVTWKNGDDVLATEVVLEGTIPAYKGVEPTKPEDNAGIYTFAGWTPEVDAVTGDITYTAQFTTGKKYEVIWKNGDDVLASEFVLDGTMPVYKGETPVKAEDDAGVYTFIGWSPEISAVTGAVTYTAQFSTVKKYTVIWKNGSDVLATERVLEGSVPTFKGEEPAKAEDDAGIYTFIGWNPEINAVTGDVTYTAVFDIVEKYTVTWKNGETVLDTDLVIEGRMPAYTGETPVKASTVSHTYTFIGWSPEITEATKNITYTAQFSESLRVYKVTFQDGDNSKTVDVEYGKVATAPDWSKAGYTLSWKLGDKAYDLNTAISGDITLSAVWTARNDTPYTIKVYTQSKAGQDAYTDITAYVEKLQGLKGTTGATAQVADILGESDIPANYHLNATKSVLFGTIAGDGSLVLSVYCDLNEKLAFDFENAIDMNYMGIGDYCGTANFDIVNAADEGLPANTISGANSKVLKMYGQTESYPQLKVSFGKTLPAGTVISMDVAFKDPNGSTGWFGFIVNGTWHQSENAYWMGDGLYWARLEITLANDASYITIGGNYEGNFAAISDKSAMVAYFDNIFVKEPKDSFDFEDAKDIAYMGIGANCGTAKFAIVDAASEGLPVNTISGANSKVLKMYGQSGNYPQLKISFGKTLPAGTVIFMDVAFKDPNGSTGWFGFIVNGTWHQSENAYWMGDGLYWARLEITLANDASYITIGGNYEGNFAAISDKSAMVAYFDNIFVKEPKDSFDFEDPTDIAYMGIGDYCGKANFAIVDATEEGLPATNEFGEEMGKVLKMYGHTMNYPQAKISFGQTLSAGTKIKVNVTFKGSTGWFGFIINGKWHESDNAYWGSDGVYWAVLEITLGADASYITIGGNYDGACAGIADKSAMVAYIGSVTVVTE